MIAKTLVILYLEGFLVTAWLLERREAGSPGATLRRALAWPVLLVRR